MADKPALSDAQIEEIIRRVKGQIAGSGEGQASARRADGP